MDTSSIRVGICGCDSSHAPAFAELISTSFEKDSVRVAGYFQGGSPDMEVSVRRVDEFARRLDRLGIPRFESIDDLCNAADHILLTRVDARLRASDFEQLSRTASSIFIDKPLALDRGQAEEIRDIATRRDVPTWTASALRFAPGLKAAEGKKILSVEVSGPLFSEPPIPEMFWYGIHTIEMLFALLGRKITLQSIMRRDREVELYVTNSRGQEGVARLGSHLGSFAGVVQTRDERISFVPWTGDIANLYRPLVAEIVRFFRTGIPPITLDESVRVIELLEQITQALAKPSLAQP